MASNIDAGVGQHATITNPTALAGSVTQNPLTPCRLVITLLRPLTPRSPQGPLVLNLLLVLSLLLLHHYCLHQRRWY